MSAGASTQKYGTILTAAGRAAIANAVATNTLVELKYIALGDGGGGEYYPGESQTALRNQVYQMPANSVSIDAENPNWIVIEGMAPESAGGFTIREVAIKGADGTVLAIGSYPSSYKPKLEEGSAVGLGLKIILEITNADVVSMNIDPSTVYATIAYVDKKVSGHAKETNAHGGTYQKTPNRLMLRNKDGRCQVAEPQEGADAANKEWLERKLADAMNSLTDKLSNGRAYPGKIELLADPYDELPPGYYACYGARYALETPQGQALQSLSPRLRSILGITVTAAGINVPQMKGYFLRAVDGITRLPGSIEQDAARPVTASARSSASGGGTVSFTGKFSAYKAGNGTDQPASGVFSETRLWAGGYDGGSGPIAIYNIGMNASASVSAPTVSTTITINQANQADENRPLNIGMTPAIYLAV